MRTRTIVTTVALGVCLGLSTVPAQAGLNPNGLNPNGLNPNGLTMNGFSLNGWTHDFTLQPTSGERASSPGVPSDSLPFQRLSQQGIGKRSR